ncbi:MAG TPA: NHL repeat-containing protein [Pyrinomonadaceae bacterium]|nr:NHL repeat-containing protein [Pyrinomonadaceae bacterium]
MRKAIVLLILLLLVAGASITFFLVRQARKPLPTSVGWRAKVTTFAGDGSPLFRDSQQPTQAGFSDPFGIAIADDGTIYVADAGESNRIRKITSEGILTSLAGGNEGFADGAGAAASFNTPSGLAIDSSGNLYVADTGNNRIRKVTPQGEVSAIAGDGTSGYIDGAAAQARFNGPISVAVDATGNVFVADTYNDRVRKISPDGQVSTVAGAGTPGYADGDRNSAQFDTPCGVIAMTDGSLIVADTGNDRLRKIAPDGSVSTVTVNLNGEEISSPVGLALTHDNFLYVTELDRSRVIQIAPDGTARVIAGRGAGFANGSDGARFNQPAGIAVVRRTGELYVTDGANYLVRKLDHTTTTDQSTASAAATTQLEPLPRLTNETLNQQSLIWPFDPQDSPHEVVATLGEVRGSFDTTDSRHHLHSGLDVFGAYGSLVRAVRSEKVTSPLPNWGLDSLNEGMRAGLISYIHIHVGRDKDSKMFDDPRFQPVIGADGKLARVRIKRGTRFRPGDAVGTVNRMYHVHLNVGPPGGEVNPLFLTPVGFKDDIAPTIEKNGIQLFDQSGKQFTEKSNGRLLITGNVRIVVDAFDRTNMNPDRRRLGLYRLGYQLLKPDGSPAPGFTDPRITLLFDRLPPDRDSTKIAYADQSGITVYGSATTRFLYEVTNVVSHGQATAGLWDTSQVPPGDYTLRIIAADYSGNEAQDGRDLLIAIR